MRFFSKNTNKKSPCYQKRRKTENQRRICRKKTTVPFPMRQKERTVLSLYAAFVFALICFPATALATSDPIQVVNNLSDFIFGLVKAVGMIMLGFGIVQVGLSLKSHDPSQRANGFLTLAGGIVITFAKEILTIITG
jgi:ABC-type amino acid transport system permease subunit